MRSMVLLMVLCLLVATTVAIGFGEMSKAIRGMFYHVGHSEVIDARDRMGLHIPSEKDKFNTWTKMKK